jgi:hypothetical protein
MDDNLQTKHLTPESFLVITVFLLYHKYHGLDAAKSKEKKWNGTFLKKTIYVNYLDALLGNFLDQQGRKKRRIGQYFLLKISC